MLRPCLRRRQRASQRDEVRQVVVHGLTRPCATRCWRRHCPKAATVGSLRQGNSYGLVCAKQTQTTQFAKRVSLCGPALEFHAGFLSVRGAHVGECLASVRKSSATPYSPGKSVHKFGASTKNTRWCSKLNELVCPIAHYGAGEICGVFVVVYPSRRALTCINRHPQPLATHAFDNTSDEDRSATCGNEQHGLHKLPNSLLITVFLLRCTPPSVWAAKPDIRRRDMCARYGADAFQVSS